MYMWNQIEDCHYKSSIQQREDSFHEQTGLQVRKKPGKCHIWSTAVYGALRIHWRHWKLKKEATNCILCRVRFRKGLCTCCRTHYMWWWWWRWGQTWVTVAPCQNTVNLLLWCCTLIDHVHRQGLWNPKILLAQTFQLMSVIQLSWKQDTVCTSTACSVICSLACNTKESLVLHDEAIQEAPPPFTFMFQVTEQMSIQKCLCSSVNCLGNHHANLLVPKAVAQ